MAWFMLIVAGLLEIVWALALKGSDGFSKAGPTVLFAVAAAGSFYLLAAALRELPVGTAYAVWTGIGAVGAAIAGIILFGEPSDALKLVGIGLIAAGIAALGFAS